jgi:hypothetical protein
VNQRSQVRVLSAVALAITILASSSAYAQGSTDVSAGYQFGHVSENGFGDNYPYGWYADVSHIVAPMFAVVGEVGGIYNSEDGITEHEYSYQGGVRVFSVATPTVHPFGQVLLGGVNAGGGGSSVNAFAFQFGAGVDIKTTAAVGLRVGVDYRRDFFSDTDGGGENVVRVVLGVVFGGK